MDILFVVENFVIVAQVAPDIRIGGGQRQRAPKIWSELGGLGHAPLGNFFQIMQNAENWAIFHFCQALAWNCLRKVDILL